MEIKNEQIELELQIVIETERLKALREGVNRLAEAVSPILESTTQQPYPTLSDFHNAPLAIHPKNNIFNLIFRHRIRNLEKKIKKLKAKLKSSLKKHYFDKRPQILLFKVVANIINMGNEDHAVYFSNSILQRNKLIKLASCRNIINPLKNYGPH